MALSIELSNTELPMIYIREDAQDLFKAFSTLDDFMQLEVNLVRDFKNRKTGHFKLGKKTFYIKKHFAAGLTAILSELFHLRKPHIGAAPEKSAIERITTLGLDTMKVVAFGQNNASIANQKSFLITEEITNTQSLEDICKHWPSNPPSESLKLSLIKKVANIAKTLHDNGMNHRDFYICHFLLDNSDASKLYLIDLHRLQQRPTLPLRWRVKDIGGLYFSAMDIGLTRRDFLRFIRHYTGQSLRQNFSQNKRFWQNVHQRALTTYKKDFGRSPNLVIEG